MKKIYFSLIACLFAFSQVLAQRTVYGKVTDETGGGLPGVNVVTKGTTIGTTTDLDGNYQLTIDGNETLVFSFVGFETQEIETGTRTTIDVSMGGATELAEVVITGVGAAVDKRKVGIAVEGLNADEIEDVNPTSDLSKALIGKVPGSLISSVTGQPGTQQSIVLRGINSLGGTQPMILIDGVQVNTDNNSNGSGNSVNGAGGTGGNLSSRLADIDLSNVERIEVVQGAAAATIYGAQGANGVIQIFTKKGQEGKPRFSFGSSYSVNNAITNNFKLADAHHFATIDGSGQIADGAGNPLASDPSNGIWATPAGAIDGTTTSSNPFTESTYDNINAFLKSNAVASNSYFNVSGGASGLTYLASISYLDQESNINGALERTNIRLNLEAELAPGVTFNSNSNYITSLNTTGTITGANDTNSGISNAINTPQYIDLTAKDANGNFVANPADDNSINPFYTFDNRLYESTVNRIIQNFGAVWDISNVFSLDAKYGFDRYNYQFTDFVRNQTESLSTAFLAPQDGQIIRRFERGTTQNSIVSLFSKVDFERDFKSSLPIDWTTQIAFDYRQNDYARTVATGVGLPTFTQDVNLSQTGTASVTENENTFITYGYLVNTKFDYNGMFGVSGGFRTDFSSAFGEGSKPFTFPRADVYVRPSELDFWSPVKNTLSEFKLRAAYGEAGVQPTAFARINTLVPVSIDQNNSLNVNSTLRNAALGIQVSKELEMGIDGVISLPSEAFLPYLNFSFTFWDRKSEDIIRSINVAPSTGSSAILDNSLTFESEGIQASLSTTMVETDQFAWDLTVNYSKSQNVVADISNDLDITLGNNFVLREGEVLGAIFGFKPLSRLDQTREDGSFYIEESDRDQFEVGPNGYVVNIDQKAVQFTDEQEIIGDPTPDFNMSFINDFSLTKNLKFGFQLDWVKGFDIYNQTKQWLYRDLVHDDVDDPITIGGETAAWTNFYQTAYRTNDKNSAFVEDGSFLRLRNIYLSYDFAQYVSALSRLKLTLSGNNLLTWTDYSGFDPEANSTVNSAITRGLDQFAFPNFKTLSLKLDVTF